MPSLVLLLFAKFQLTISSRFEDGNKEPVKEIHADKQKFVGFIQIVLYCREYPEYRFLLICLILNIVNF